MELGSAVVRKLNLTRLSGDTAMVQRLDVRSARLIVCTFAFVVGTTAAAHAQGWSVNGQLLVNPDQVAFGANYELGPITDRVWLQPNGTVGIGNDITTLAANFDVMYRAWQPKGPWRIDVGGGPAINHYSFTDHAETDAGFNLVGALVNTNGWVTELRIGFIDSPDLSIGLGYRFGAHTRTSPKRH